MTQQTTYDLLHEELNYLQGWYASLIREHRINRDGLLREGLPEGRLLEGEGKAPAYMWMMQRALDEAGSNLDAFRTLGQAASLTAAVKDLFFARQLPDFTGVEQRMTPPTEGLMALFRECIAPKALEELVVK